MTETRGNSAITAVNFSVEKSGVGQDVGSAVISTVGNGLGAAVKTKDVVMRDSSTVTDKVSAVLLVVEYVVFVVGLAVALVWLPLVGSVVLSIAVGTEDVPRAAEGGLALVEALAGAAVGKDVEITDTEVLVGAAVGAAAGDTGRGALVVGAFVGEVGLDATLDAAEEGLALIGPAITGPTVTGLAVTGELVTTFNVGPAV
jgi:hypothetical protein